MEINKYEGRWAVMCTESREVIITFGSKQMAENYADGVHEQIVFIPRWLEENDDNIVTITRINDEIINLDDY